MSLERAVGSEEGGFENASLSVNLVWLRPSCWHAGTLCIRDLRAHGTQGWRDRVVVALLLGDAQLQRRSEYCELERPIRSPVAMSYVREAYGSGILSYLVGSWIACRALSTLRCRRLVSPCCRSWSPGIVPIALLVIGIFTCEPRCYSCNAQVILGAFCVFALRGCGFCESQGLYAYTQGKDIDRRTFENIAML